MPQSTCEDGSRDVAESAAGPVLLALSTFRRSDAAVEAALERARGAGKLLVLFVADRNLARYMAPAELGYFADMERRCEEGVLREHEQEGKQIADAIAARAREAGIEVGTEVCTGRFGIECVRVAGRERPSVIVTTRSRRPRWMRRFFGSPVDHVIERAGCPVVEA